MNWKEETLHELTKNLNSDPNWKNIALHIQNNNSNLSIHLAIFTEVLMEKLIIGQKKLESRFSSNRISPHGQIKKGDIIVAKKSGGPVSAVFLAGEVITYLNLNSAKVAELKRKHSEELGLSTKDNFWTVKSDSKYATFINVDKIKKLRPFSINKKDRTGWVVIKSGCERSLF